MKIENRLRWDIYQTFGHARVKLSDLVTGDTFEWEGFPGDIKKAKAYLMSFLQEESTPDA